MHAAEVAMLQAEHHKLADKHSAELVSRERQHERDWEKAVEQHRQDFESMRRECDELHRNLLATQDEQQRRLNATQEEFQRKFQTAQEEFQRKLQAAQEEAQESQRRLSAARAETDLVNVAISQTTEERESEMQGLRHEHQKRVTDLLSQLAGQHMHVNVRTCWLLRDVSSASQHLTTMQQEKRC